MRLAEATAGEGTLRADRSTVEHPRHILSIDPAADEDAAVALLRVIAEHPEYSQRQLASELGVSLGKAHYLLKALLAKGWVKAQNFQRNEKKLGYLYMLTPSGVRHRMQLTQSFLARKEREYVKLRSQISALRKDLANHRGPQA